MADAASTASDKRKEEVSDITYGSDYSTKYEKDTLLYGDQEIDTCKPSESRKTLSPENFDIVNDEDLTYQNLFVSDQNADRFQPPKQSGDPAPDVYITRDEEFQIRPDKTIETDCVCADGSKARGRKNVRTGKIDCECNKNLAKKPSVYQPKKNKPRKIDAKPFKAQAGVSYMGNVNMDVCDTFDNEARERANATLNNIVQIGKENSKKTHRQDTLEKGKILKQNSYNIYDKCNHQLWGL